MKTNINQYINFFLLGVAITILFSINKTNSIKDNQPTQTDSLNYQIKVRDSIIYDLYQENKRLKLSNQ